MTIYYRNKISKKIGNNEVILLNNLGKIYNGNSSFFAVWELLNGQNSVSEIINFLAKKYQENYQTIKKDVNDIIKKMLNMNFINSNSFTSAPISYLNTTITSVHIELTNNCNLKCKHCYLKCLKLKREWDTSKLKKVLKQLASFGVLSIELSGGEPLLHSEFYEILEYTKKIGFHIKLFTNGTLIEKNNVDILKNYVNEFRISLDGPKYFHDLRRGKGAYDKTVSALNLLKNANVQISTTITEQTIKDLNHLESLVSQSPLHHIAVSPIIPYSYLDYSNYDYRSIINTINKWGNKSSKKLKPNRTKVFGAKCEAGDKVIYISSSGNVYPCPLLIMKGMTLGNVLKNKIAEIISLKNNNLFEFFVHKKKLQNMCFDCNSCQYWCLAMINTYSNNKNKFSSPFCNKNKSIIKKDRHSNNVNIITPKLYLKKLNIEKPILDSYCFLCYNEDIIDLIPPQLKIEKIDYGHQKLYKVHGINNNFYISILRTGSSMSSLDYELVSELNFKFFINIGFSGTFRNDMNFGQFVIVKNAYVGEGVSKYYNKKKINCSNFNHKNKIIQTMNTLDIKYTYGNCYTTDAFFRETPSLLKKLNKKNIHCIDMESSALYSVANYKNKEMISLLLITDNLFNFNWRLDSKNIKYYKKILVNFMIKFSEKDI